MNDEFMLEEIDTESLDQSQNSRGITPGAVCGVGCVGVGCGGGGVGAACGGACGGAACGVLC